MRYLCCLLKNKRLIKLLAIVCFSLCFNIVKFVLTTLEEELNSLTSFEGRAKCQGKKVFGVTYVYFQVATAPGEVFWVGTTLTHRRVSTINPRGTGSSGCIAKSELVSRINIHIGIYIY